MKKIIFSIDVEKDLHGNSYRGVTEGLKIFEKLCAKHKIKPILFVTGDCIIRYSKLFKRLAGKGWDISFHGLTHNRFDEMSYSEKENEIKKGVEMWKKKLGFKPKGFRAPQHSIDNKTLDLLEKYEFKYDSSYHPLNLLQLLFFPKKIGLWFKLFFSRLNEYKIRNNLNERTLSSLLIPFVSLTIRVFPRCILYVYVKLISVVYKNPMFYAHSWDFIEMKESKIDRWFSHDKLINKFDYVMSI